MILTLDKIYHISSSDGIAIFRYDGLNSNDNTSGKYITDMNSHWGIKSNRFINKSDVNTYPFYFDGGHISLEDREMREATASESLWLNKCIEMDDMISIEDYRDIKLDEILFQLD